MMLTSISSLSGPMDCRLEQMSSDMQDANERLFDVLQINCNLKNQKDPTVCSGGFGLYFKKCT